MTDPTENDIRVRGTLSSAGDLGVVRIELSVGSTAAEVWAAVTEPERLARWYGEVDGDLRVGGSYRAMLFPSGWDGTGHVLACDPGSRLLVEGAEPGKRPVTDELRLTMEGVGSTRIVLTKRGVPLGMIAAHGVGTQIHLENLSAHLGGREPVEPEPYWTVLLPRYEQAAVLLEGAPPAR